MASTPSGPGNYWVPLLGLAGAIGGVGSLGTLLAVAGGGHGWTPTLALLVAAVVFTGGGLTLLTRGGSNGKGGWRRSTMTGEERRVYRAEFRAFSRRRRVSGETEKAKPRR